MLTDLTGENESGVYAATPGSSTYLPIRDGREGESESGRSSR